MNPMTNMKNVLKLSEQELRTANKTSWHDQYRHSAWLFVGGLPYDLTEGDIICVFSQYGEVVNINLVRDKGTGKSKGFCFICYEDQRSTNLAVDNFNGIKLLSRTIRVDHCEDYKAPKDDKMDQETQQLHSEGCAPGSRFGNAPVLPSSAGTTGGLNKGLELPPMGSLLKIKTEKETPSKRSQEDEDRLVKKATEYKNKFTKQSEKRHRDTSTSSSQSDSALESEPNRTLQRKSPKKTRRKDKFSSSCEEGARVQKSKVQKMEAERERIANDEERERIVNDEKRERIVNDEKRDNTEPRRERIGHESKYGGKKKVLDERERDISPRRNQSKKGKGATQIKDEIRKLFKRRN